ncbi:hypothetical protein FE697_017235 [Mumia zhuanghuii]|uniref:Z1 domain-containing protein n=2 Tax=Mumia TaxID=1546255 RepID=A0ABW1QPI0_9ACTN|nr:MULTISPECIES: Z1 domain-containing protein [Mumia]KAA1420685.1 hypothetical protein FE697_017235 [Mumia zhuanghuii]
MSEPGAARFGTTAVERASTGDRVTWWDAYNQSLRASGLGEESRRAVADDADFIVDTGIFGAGSPGDDGWPESRERVGLVMGAVQSGKTASMMAVAAKAMDAGVDAVVVLAGTRSALWLQTFERLVSQLDALPDGSKRRVLVPSRRSMDSDAGIDLSMVYGVSRQQARRAVAKSRPFIAVVMKNVAHLQRAAQMLHETVYPAAARRTRPFHLLVIDDEADDSSVMDTGTEDVEHVLEQRQVPRRIVDLWEARRRPGETASPHLYATYIAYTATPQANFLQNPDNPLAPRDFVVGLRTPGAEGSVEVRSPSYRVSDGLDGWYTGGDIFYRRFAAARLCVTVDDLPPDAATTEAIRAFLVASAVRLMREPDRKGPRTSRTVRGVSSREVTDAVARPASMLIHPGAGKDEHFEVADEVLAWSRGGTEPPDDGARTLGSVGIAADMDLSPERWLRWLRSYGESSEFVAAAADPYLLRRIPEDGEWDEVRRLILEEIVPGTTVAVINSDERADDRPNFSPIRSDDGWVAPPNLSTIFVSGNVMSRGLTLEGLLTTLFSRSSDQPLADTQMQMQRWFGYRGPYIDLCRVFVSQEQLALFAQYDENDEALRTQILEAMASDPDRAPDVTVLQGHSFRATGKIAGAKAVQLWPGPRPFVRHMNPVGGDRANLELVGALRAEPMHKVDASKVPRGFLLERTLDLAAAADLLDRLRYADHARVSDDERRWATAESHAKMSSGDFLSPLYRAPDSDDIADIDPSPYDIAAYLRLWAAALDRRVPGMMSTDDPPVSWRLLDLDRRAEQQPRFRIGIRTGTGEPLTGGPLAGLRPMRRELLAGTNDLVATWGSRNRTGGVIRGDELFDYEMLGEPSHLTTAEARAPGSDGLILFHVIDRGGGQATIAVGVAIPVGGPDHVQARRSTDE